MELLKLVRAQTQRLEIVSLRRRRSRWARRGQFGGSGHGWNRPGINTGCLINFCKGERQPFNPLTCFILRRPKKHKGHTSGGAEREIGGPGLDEVEVEVEGRSCGDEVFGVNVLSRFATLTAVAAAAGGTVVTEDDEPPLRDHHLVQLNALECVIGGCETAAVRISIDPLQCFSAEQSGEESRCNTYLNVCGREPSQPLK